WPGQARAAGVVAALQPGLLGRVPPRLFRRERHLAGDTARAPSAPRGGVPGRVGRGDVMPNNTTIVLDSREMYQALWEYVTRKGHRLTPDGASQLRACPKPGAPPGECEFEFRCEVLAPEAPKGGGG